MAVTLQREEASLVKEILVDYLSDLRMEIANTEKYEMREDMKRQEVAIKALIARLEGSLAEREA